MAARATGCPAGAAVIRDAGYLPCIDPARDVSGTRTIGQRDLTAFGALADAVSSGSLRLRILKLLPRVVITVA